MNLMDMDYEFDSYDWWEALSPDDKEIVIECQTNLFRMELLEMKAELHYGI
jgi:hypothetical protein